MGRFRAFNSKILLFGEYSLLLNSKALAIPYDLYQGILSFPERSLEKSGSWGIDKVLLSFCSFLKIKSLSYPHAFWEFFDLDGLSYDIQQGLYFKSTIPQGIGLGSSGALVAAIFESYCLIRKNLQNTESIRHFLAMMESFFHEKSSGIDPYISLSNQVGLINESGIISSQETSVKDLLSPFKQKGGPRFFLVHTNLPRQTAPLVKIFLEKLQSSSFDLSVQEKFCTITNTCVETFLRAEFENLHHSFGLLSEFQRQHFSPMIPYTHHALWEEGLKTENFFLKLCGAGGGGNLLGFTKDLEYLEGIKQHYAIRPL